MKFLISFIIINTLSCLTFAGTPNNNEAGTSNSNGTQQISNEVEDTRKTDLNEFLVKLQAKPDIITRTVKTDEGENSIKNFFESSGTTANNTNNWQITNQEVNRTGFLINIVVSCEYSESTHYIIKLIAKVIDVLFKNNIEKNQNDIEDSFFKPIKPVLSNMIFTLVGLLNYTNNYSLKNHELLNILLSWYVYIMNSGNYQYDAETDYKTVYNIEYLPVTNYQLEKFLKIFILNNCREVNDYEMFKKRIDEELGSITTKADFTSLLSRKLSALNLLTSNAFLTRKYKINELFVFNQKSKYSITLVNVLGSYYIRWENQKFKFYYYDNYVPKTASGIKSLLNFEKYVLKIITQIIIAHIAEELANILYDRNLSDTQRYTEIQTKFIPLLDTYIEKFKTDGQPFYLINNMSIIKSDLWALCHNNKPFENKKKNFDNYITKLCMSKTDVYYPSLSELRQFLEKISKSPIYIVLHPSITNAYWKKMYFAPTKISDYIVDLKYLLKKHEKLPANDTTTCKTLSNISGKLKAIEKKIPLCESEIKSNNSDGLTTCFNELNSQYTRLKIKTDDVVSNIVANFKFNWKKLLLSIVHNIDHVQSFLKYGKDKNKMIQDLKLLHNSIVEYFDVGFYVTCKSEPVYKEETDTEVIESETTLSQAEYRGMNRNLVDISSYHNFFKNIDELIGKIIDRNIEPDLTLYWDGITMTLKNVYDMHRIYPRDQLQINYDYFQFLVKWFLAVVYSKIIEITNEIIKSDIGDLPPNILLKVCFVDELELMFQEFQKLPLYISMPVSNLLGGFVSVLKSYIDDISNNEGLTKYIDLIKLELENLDYVPPTTNIDRTFSIHIGVVIETIRDLITIYDAHRSTIENAATTIGMDLNDIIMMYHNWN